MTPSSPPPHQTFRSVFQEHIFSVKSDSFLSGIAFYIAKGNILKSDFMEVMHLFLIDLQMQGQLSIGRLVVFF